jgi:DNA-binding MarR family transcriptional regulator
MNAPGSPPGACGYDVFMSRASALLAALTREPASTSEVYDRVGYATLTRVGLVPYHAFRAQLAALSAAGLVESRTDADGATVWRLAQTSAGDELRDPHLDPDPEP